MKLNSLIIKNFRGYRDIKIPFNENLNLIIGRNDVGKSTILDAPPLAVMGVGASVMGVGAINIGIGASRVSLRTLRSKYRQTLH